MHDGVTHARNLIGTVKKLRKKKSVRNSEIRIRPENAAVRATRAGFPAQAGRGEEGRWRNCE